MEQYPTPTLNSIKEEDYDKITLVPHIWKTGDRFYKLANDFYNDPNYWWVIAWYNGLPTEADINFGDVIEIPVKIEDALRVLGI